MRLGTGDLINKSGQICQYIIQRQGWMSAARIQSSLSTTMVVLSMINGMIGGISLLLPVLALQTGYALSILVIIGSGFFSYYSCYLCVLHVGNQPDLDSAIFKHFNRSYKAKHLYDICIFVSLFLIDMLYFELIVLQWIGLTPPHYFNHLNPILNALLLLTITLLMKYYEFGAKLMAYGIISIIIYLIFLTWVFLDQSTPEAKKTFPPFGENSIQLFATMGMGFSIQNFFIPILKRSKEVSDHQKLLKLAYIMGVLVYLFISVVGSYGIFYRSPLGYNEGMKTIEGYFGTGTWQVNIIQVIYLIHLYSVFPQFLLISKKRLFNVLNIDQSPSRVINWKEAIYVSFFITVCLVIAVLRISMRDIIDINGAFLGFVFIYLIPSALHVKCMYFSKAKVALGTLSQKDRQIDKYEVMIEEGNMGLQTEEKKQSGEQMMKRAVDTKIGRDAQPQRAASKDNEIHKRSQVQMVAMKKSVIIDDDGVNGQQEYQCGCWKSDYSLRAKILDGAVVACMFLVGFYILVDTILQLV